MYKKKDNVGHESTSPSLGTYVQVQKRKKEKMDRV